MKNLSCILFILLLLSVQLSAQDAGSVKALFAQQKYSAVISATDKLTDFNVNQQPEMALLRAQAYYKSNNFQRAITVLKLFNAEFSNSLYRIPATYYLGVCLVKTGDYKQAVISLAEVEAAGQGELSLHAKKMLSVISSVKLAEADLQWLKEQNPSAVVQKYLAEAVSSLHILVVLPLTGASGKEGKEILNGLKYAVNTLHKDQSPAIFLDVVNSESNIAIMQKKVYEKLALRHYNLIIGELKSQPTAALAGLAAMAKIPLISPTAGDNNISEISEYIYQLNSSSFTMGEQLAAFAIDSLKYKTFAILAPVTAEGKESVAGFMDKINKKGGKIVTQEWYYETTDLSKQMQKIRESALEVSKMSVHKYMQEDSLKKVAVPGIDAIFLPISREEIKPISPQVAYYNLKCNLLGSYGWDSPKELNKVADKIDSLVFVRENNLSPENSQYADFVNKYRLATGKAPAKLEVIGYDAMLFYLKLLKSANGQSLLNTLKQVQEFSGVYGKIKFEPNRRSNSAVELFRYTIKNGIKRIGL